MGRENHDCAACGYDHSFENFDEFDDGNNFDDDFDDDFEDGNNGLNDDLPPEDGYDDGFSDRERRNYEAFDRLDPTDWP